jgi:hypothetical protein
MGKGLGYEREEIFGGYPAPHPNLFNPDLLDQRSRYPGDRISTASAKSYSSGPAEIPGIGDSMIEFENQIVIARPVSEVFAFVSDLENLPKWNYFVIRVRKISGDPTAVGARFLQERKTDRQELAIVELERDHSLTVEPTTPPV